MNNSKKFNNHILIYKRIILEKGKQDFIAEIKKNIPSSFNSLKVPTIKINDLEIENSAYYLNNILGYEKGLRNRVLELGHSKLILDGFVSAVTDFFQNLMFIFVHVNNDNLEEYDTMVNNFFDSLRDLEMYNDALMSKKHSLTKANLKEAFVFIIESIEDMMVFTYRFSRIEIKKTPLVESINKLLNSFEESLNKLENSNTQECNYKLHEFINVNKVESREEFINILVDEFQLLHGKKLATLLNILLKNKLLIYSDRDGKSFYKTLLTKFKNAGSYPTLMRNFPKDIEMEFENLSISSKEPYNREISNLESRLAPILKRFLKSS